MMTVNPINCLHRQILPSMMFWMNSNICIGIDPGLRHTGWGVVRITGSQLSYLGSGVVDVPVMDDLSKRLHCLHEGISHVITQYRPDMAAIEQTFVSKNGASTLKLGNARGALLLTLALHHLPVSEYDATLVKKSVVGAGRASKEQISHMMRILLPACDSETSPDAMDALAVAVTHAHHYKYAALVS